MSMMLEFSPTEEEYDELETQAAKVRDAMFANDLDTAYILASTSPYPVLLAMYVAASCNDSFRKTLADLEESWGRR